MNPRSQRVRDATAPLPDARPVMPPTSAMSVFHGLPEANKCLRRFIGGAGNFIKSRSG
jgi:hypothetical protein